MNISDLYAPMNLDKSLIGYGRELMHRPTDFSSANRSFAGLMQNPMMFQGTGGNVFDPQQSRASAGNAYLGERSGIAQTDMAQKASFADLLMRAGSDYGSLMEAMKALQAQQMNAQSSGLLGLF